jgi:hypothetical protein
MKKTYPLLLLFLITGIFSFHLQGQQKLDAAPFATLITQQGSGLVQAMVNADAETFCALVHPDFLTMVGGRERVELQFKSPEMREEDRVESTLESPLTLVSDSGNYYCAVAVHSYNRGGTQMKKHFLCYLIGISADKGKTWGFIPLVNNEPNITLFAEKMEALGLIFTFPQTDEER